MADLSKIEFICNMIISGINDTVKNKSYKKWPIKYSIGFVVIFSQYHKVRPSKPLRRYRERKIYNEYIRRYKEIMKDFPYNKDDSYKLFGLYGFLMCHIMRDIEVHLRLLTERYHEILPDLV